VFRDLQSLGLSARLEEQISSLTNPTFHRVVSTIHHSAVLYADGASAAAAAVSVAAPESSVVAFDSS